jgi:hypothetical protein
MKVLGFDEPCLAFYDGKNTESFYFNNIRDGSGDYVPFQKHDKLKWFGAPLYQQAFRWFREKYPEINPTYNLLFILDKTSQTENPMTYEECELACLEKLIEIAEQKEKEL